MLYSLDLLKFYLNYCTELAIYELLPLIETIDLKKLMEPELVNKYLLPLSLYLGDGVWYTLLTEAQPGYWFIDSNIELNFFFKVLLILHIFLVKFFFLSVTPITFWAFPTFLLLFIGLILLFFIKPNGLNMQIWSLAKLFLLIILFYQLFLTYFYIYNYQMGFILKVGLAGTLIAPFNIGYAKLLSLIFIFLTLVITVFFYLEYYTKNILIIKPELVPILFFLGFGAGMVFLQNDLFAMFLYFEIISFCIYGLLFLQKRTNAQLHGLVRYVLFSLWTSTCYILGTVFYIAALNTTTALFDFIPTDDIVPEGCSLEIFSYISLDNFWLLDLELLLAITFILVYFLFKLGAGPFYTWTIEVYNASSTSALLAISLVPKLIYIPLLFFLLYFNFLELYLYWSYLLFGVGLLTIFVGSFGILLTEKLKEIYAWSSLIHTGNMLIIMSCVSSVTLTFIMFYLVSYYLISFAFIVLITSLWNQYTGWFIKNISELTSLNFLHSNFYCLALLVLASAAGFTPFLSFFMKFSLLTLVTNHFGILLTILIGIMNIIGSVAYLRMLRNIIGFNIETFKFRHSEYNPFFIEIWTSYFIAWIFNFTCFLILFSFLYYKNFLDEFGYYSLPIIVGEYYDLLIFPFED